MPRHNRQNLLRAVIRQPAIRLPNVVSRLLFAGIRSKDPLVRRRQMFTNIVAYVTALNAVVHFITNAMHDFQGLMSVNIYNALMFVFCILNHQLHRFGSLAAAISLILAIAFGHTFVVFAFGTASDLHFYFTLAGFVLFLVGVENYRTFLALYAIGVIALLVSFFFVPENGFLMTTDDAFRRNLAFEAAMNAIVMNGVLISLVLFALHRAEQRSEALLGSILPARIVERLKRTPDRRIADRKDGCSVLFLDLVGFTKVTATMEPEEVVAFLDGVFSALDGVCERIGIDKIKTIGDCYMAVGGLETDPKEGARRMGIFALAAMKIVDDAPGLGDARMTIRAGIHTGPVTAGIIGDSRVSYDVWGDTVNTASRMESHGEPGRIHVSKDYRDLVADDFAFEARGEIEVKSLGARATYFLTGPR